MSYFGSTDWYHEVKEGEVDGYSIVNKFGAINALTTALTPVCTSGTYQTPTALTSLEIVSSDNTNDKAGGTGALTVRVYGLSTGWTEVTEDVTLNGTTAVALSNQYYRVYRMRVLTSGAYANATTPSHNSTITLRTASAGATWANIPPTSGGFGFGQSLIGAYTIPQGYKGSIISETLSVESNKAVSFYFFVRENADDVTTPFDAMRIQQIDKGVAGVSSDRKLGGYGEFFGPCDMGFLAKTSTGTADIAVSFEILLEAV